MTSQYFHRHCATSVADQRREPASDRGRPSRSSSARATDLSHNLGCLLPGQPERDVPSAGDWAADDRRPPCCRFERGRAAGRRTWTCSGLWGTCGGGAGWWSAEPKSSWSSPLGADRPPRFFRGKEICHVGES